MDTLSIEKMRACGLERVSTTQKDRERIDLGFKQLTPKVEAGMKEVNEWLKRSNEAQEWFPGCRAM